LATKSSAVIGSLNIPNVPPVAPAWPSALVVAQQSVSVTVLKPARNCGVAAMAYRPLWMDYCKKQDAAKHQSPSGRRRRRTTKRAQRLWL